ncbi:hypothetical protein F7230_02460 [Corynebacterium sp. 320]|uniref:Rv1157c family protein n=1 Tax=Corynebacterium TaxID=1716 RepID=UPI00125CBE05|nr:MULTISPECIES: hypothetical protein [Corynebacterium]KAB1503986.1 hypothetical protein F7230_02460 [Corynebacterium sp. 320]KAB1552915.1 hypothetical protein F7233_04135 [Corynebacterium sp. 321]KAB1553866.1 hypothetical protein F7232_02445 [Corynebacterium sp. 319]KAB3528122.1 hypothetical protein F8354_02460 [Corynebacterium sp. 250]KAB3540390.1 hypothetical protein F8390_03880 [Corynebacterium sp. 366]
MSITKRSFRALVGLSTACALAVPTLIAPATANAQVGSLDHLGRPNAETLNAIEEFTKNPNVPPQVGAALTKLVGFFRGEEGKGVPIPKNGPHFTQFAWPTISQNCIGGKNNAVGTAAAVPGPANLPLPGVAPGEVNFVFTGLGTGTIAKEQHSQMNVHWVNINNGKRGVTPLRFNGINPEGPGTVNGAAQTGPGTVLAYIDGGFTVNNKDAAPSTCNFLPTAGVIQVP